MHRPSEFGSILSVVPANPEACPRARSVLQFIRSLESRQAKRMLSGQFTNFGRRADLRLPNKIHRLTGRWPALIGVDYADFSISSGRRRTVQWLMNAVSAARFDQITHDHLNLRRPNRVAMAYWRAGGLVTVGVHCYNPANPRGGGLRDQDVALAEILAPRTATHGCWMAQLDEIAAGLLELRDAGVVVLWRPLHEMDGGWFWWGKKPPPTFIRVWRHMFVYFTEVKRLDNLLWVFGPSSGPDAADYYPGDGFVDLVGLDAYTDHVDPAHLPGYAGVAALPKPFGFGEYGPHGPANPPGNFDYRRLLDGVRSHFSRTTFFMTWNANWSPANNRHARALYLDPCIVTRADLPHGLAGNGPSAPTKGAVSPKVGLRHEPSSRVEQPIFPNQTRKAK